MPSIRVPTWASLSARSSGVTVPDGHETTADWTLELRGVGHVYPNGTRALERISLRIGRGIFGLLGPNGAGKSTLMRTLATLQRPSEGGIGFGEIDLLAEPQRLRRTLGYLPQEFGVYPRLSAYAMLDHMAVLKGFSGAGERKATVEALLHAVNLWEVRRKTLARFSAGMRQRFGIAQALIGAPRLIIVDEPTAGLDPQERNRFLDVLAEVGETATVILSTHIVDDVVDLCPRVAILAGGRILAEGAPPDLTGKVRGRIWMKSVPRGELPAHRERYRPISTRLLAGRTIVHILSDRDPGNGFAAVDVRLEDAYFAALSTKGAAE